MQVGGVEQEMQVGGWWDDVLVVLGPLLSLLSSIVFHWLAETGYHVK